MRKKKTAKPAKKAAAKKTVKKAAGKPAARKAPAKQAQAAKPAAPARSAMSSDGGARPATYAPQPIQGTGWAPFRYPPQ